MSDVHVFLLEATDNVFTVTNDRSGLNLPKWKFIRSMPREDLTKLVVNAQQAPAALAQRNFFHIEKKNWRSRTHVAAYFQETERKERS
jgi:hypothetical protein